MALNLIKALAKLDRPPAAQNWARFLGETKPDTTRSILSFVKGMPQVAYQSGSTAIRDRFLFGIERKTALALVERSGSPAGRQPNKELVDAFYDHDLERRYPVGTCIEFERQLFRISRDLFVPVSPLVVMRERGTFVPVFLCGWSNLPLSTKQRRLLMTVWEDAFLSLTDFQLSPAEFLFFPKVVGPDGKRVREAEIWHRGDYELLSPGELDEQVAMYLEARQEARAILLAAKAEDEKRQTEEEKRQSGETRSEGPTDDLFGGDAGSKKE